VQDEAFARLQATEERIIELLTALASYDPRDVIRWDDAGKARITASDDLSFASVVGIREISYKQDGTVRFSFHDRRAALMDLARLRGMITDKSATFHFHEDLARMSPEDQQRRVAELLEFAASMKVGDEVIDVTPESYEPEEE
jgi:DNA-directed RNA polymerase subunit F